MVLCTARFCCKLTELDFPKHRANVVWKLPEEAQSSNKCNAVHNLRPARNQDADADTRFRHRIKPSFVLTTVEKPCLVIPTIQPWFKQFAFVFQPLKSFHFSGAGVSEGSAIDTTMVMSIQTSCQSVACKFALNHGFHFWFSSQLQTTVSPFLISHHDHGLV